MCYKKICFFFFSLIAAVDVRWNIFPYVTSLHCYIYGFLVLPAVILDYCGSYFSLNISIDSYLVLFHKLQCVIGH